MIQYIKNQKKFQVHNLCVVGVLTQTQPHIKEGGVFKYLYILIYALPGGSHPIIQISICLIMTQIEHINDITLF